VPLAPAPPAPQVMRTYEGNVLGCTISHFAVTKRRSNRHVSIVGTRNTTSSSNPASSSPTAALGAYATADSAIDSRRALVVELLSSAVFRLIAEGRVPVPGRADRRAPEAPHRP
jgi:hypothetical protein